MKHEVNVIPKEEVLVNRSNAYEFIDFDKKETLEETAKEFANNSAVTNYEEGINVGKYQGFIEGAKWFKRGGIFAAKLQQERILDFIHSEMLDRRDYSASKMCEVITEFVENEL